MLFQVFFTLFSPKYLEVNKNCHTFARAILGYGVMVTLQILVLPFLVRVRVAQQKRASHNSVGLSCLKYDTNLKHKKNTLWISSFLYWM